MGDDIDGVPVAEHANCGQSEDCTVGWKLKGLNVAEAEYCGPSKGHPTWAIDPENMPRQPGHTHFHWLGSPEHAGNLSAGEVREGYILKLTARDHFYFKHHGGFDITPGIDYQSHTNIVPSCN